MIYSMYCLDLFNYVNIYTILYYIIYSIYSYIHTDIKYIHNMDQYQWVDVTQQITAIHTGIPYHM